MRLMKFGFKSRCVPALCAAIVAFVFCAATQVANAQNERPFTFNVGGGFTPVVGNLSTRLDNGWHFTVGAGYNFRGVFSIGPQFLYNGLGVNSTTVAESGAPNADARVWAITLDPRIQLPISTKFRPYLVGGVGYYRRTVDFTQPAIQPVTFFDPFFGFIPGVVGTNQVLGSVRRSGVGGSLGAGFSFGLGSSGAQIFTEARYHYADTGAVPTRLVPVTFGIRF